MMGLVCACVMGLKCRRYKQFVLP